MTSTTWPRVRLEELTTKVGSGATPRGGEASYKKSGVPLIRSMNVVFFGFKRDGIAYLDEAQAQALLGVEVRTEDVLLNITGASIGRVTLAPPDMDGARVNQHVCIIRPSDIVDARFLRAFLSSPEMQSEITAENYGVTRQALTKQQILDFEVPLPPLNEQKRIADKLDAILARVDACRERLDRVPDILKRFRQSVLTAATSGKLTEEWRSSHNKGMDENAGPLEWRERPLAELCERERVITYGVIKLGTEVPDGVPCLRTSNVRWLHVETEGMKRIAPALSSEYARTILRGGEVLVNVRGTLGGVVVATPEMIGWNVSREVAVVPADASQIDPSYLAFWIGSEASQRWLSRVEKGVAYIGINIEDLRNLPVRLPPIEEQREIVDRVESLYAYADRLEARYTVARAQVERLTPALLAKAFRGELVPQYPNDEPATILLERIRAARSEAVSKKQGRGQHSGAPGRVPRKKTTMTKSRNDEDVKYRPYLADLLRVTGGSASIEDLFRRADLPVTDFYKQLAWEIENDHIRDDEAKLEAA